MRRACADEGHVLGVEFAPIRAFLGEIRAHLVACAAFLLANHVLNGERERDGIGSTLRGDRHPATRYRPVLRSGAGRRCPATCPAATATARRSIFPAQSWCWKYSR